MFNLTKLAITCVCVPLITGACFGQSESGKAAEQPKYFHLDFVVKELDGGKVVNARNYATAVATVDSTCSIRTGNKVPIPTGGPGGDHNQYTFVDVGVNIDCRGGAREIDGNLALMVVAEVSSVAAGGSPMLPPMIRQTKWSSNVIVPFRKPTVIFSSDDPTSKGQMQLELTATPIK